jgi:amino acid transporter
MAIKPKALLQGDILFGLALLLLICFWMISSSKNTVVDLNIYDTYYVISYTSIYIFLGLLLGLNLLTYRIGKRRLKLNTLLTVFQFLVTVSIPILINIYLRLNPSHFAPMRYYAQVESGSFLSTYIPLILFTMLSISTFLLFINLISSEKR